MLEMSFPLAFKLQEIAQLQPIVDPIYSAPLSIRIGRGPSTSPIMDGNGTHIPSSIPKNKKIYSGKKQVAH
jgi:hypothetical protein